MYRITVFKTDDLPAEAVSVTRASEVADRLLELLDRYPECDRVVVQAGTAFLFAVDRYGRRIDEPN